MSAVDTLQRRLRVFDTDTTRCWGAGSRGTVSETYPMWFTAMLFELITIGAISHRVYCTAY
jgi:hypothetical protein